MKAPYPGKKNNTMSWLIGIVAVIAIIFLLTRIFEKDGSENTYTKPTPTSAPASSDSELPIYATNQETDIQWREVYII